MKANKYEIKITSRFKKDLKTIQKRNFDINLLNEIVLMLANDITLPQKYNNHLLEPKSKRFMGMSYKTRLVAWIRKGQQYIDFNTNSYRFACWFIWISKG